MPFGNSVLTSSNNFERQGPFDGVRLHEPGPLSDGLTHGPWVSARAPFGGDTPAHERLAALHDVMFLPGRQQILAGPPEEP